jgi:hypothetical protein
MSAEPLYRCAAEGCGWTGGHDACAVSAGSIYVCPRGHRGQLVAVRPELRAVYACRAGHEQSRSGACATCGRSVDVARWEPDPEHAGELLRAALWPAFGAAWLAIHGAGAEPPEVVRAAVDAARAGEWLDAAGSPTPEAERAALALVQLAAWPSRGTCGERWRVVRAAFVAVALGEPVTVASLRALETSEGLTDAMLRAWIAGRL